jgi:hypothetical protein
MMRTADRALALLYFERKAVAPHVGGSPRGASCLWTWFDPRMGRWSVAIWFSAGVDGVLAAPLFPNGKMRANEN